MEIGFVNFNQEALNRANKVMRLLQGQGAIDELGMGRIRDAFSNTMFPGMSTLQTRAKYFLLMPALYAFLERTNIRDVSDARAKIREYEISLTRRLMAGTPADNSWGIIGADSLRNRDSYVKYDPAYVYQAGLETYRLVKSGGNIYRMIAERARVYRDIPKKNRSGEEMEDDTDDLAGLRQLFLTSGENYDFRGKEPLSIALTYKEASLLKRQIIFSVSGTLLEYLLESGLYTSATVYDFEGLEIALAGNVPPELMYTYILSRRYSRFAYLLRMRYAMLYDLGVGADAAREKEEIFFDYLKTFQREFTPGAIEEILRFVSGRVTENSCKLFCVKAAQLLEKENWKSLDELIVRREVAIKTPSRSKLLNSKDFEQGKPFESPGLMSFRWNTAVRNMLNEIKRGLGNE